MPKITLYDPPAGWKYGFPKPYKPLEGESVEQTLVRDGYPESEFDKDGKCLWCRFWETEAIDDGESTVATLKEHFRQK